MMYTPVVVALGVGVGGEARDQEFEVSLDCITPCLNRTENVVCVAGSVNTECIL